VTVRDALIRVENARRLLLKAANRNSVLQVHEHVGAADQQLALAEEVLREIATDPRV